MSHVSTVETAIKDLNILKQALKDLGYGYYEGQQLQGRYLKGNEKVDLVIEDKSNIYGTKSVGAVKNSKGTYSFTGDLNGTKKTFAKEVTQKYTVLKLRSELKKMGAISISETTQEDGSVKLVANLS